MENTNTNEVETKLLVNVRQFASMVDLHPNTVWHLIWDGRLTYIKLGSRKSNRARVLINPAKAIAEIERLYSHPARGVR